MSDWDGPLIRFGEMSIQTDSRVYGPDDDTFLLEGHSRVPKGKRVLEVGCGTGFVSISCCLRGADVEATDTNPHAVELTGHNARLNGCELAVRHGDLFAGAGGPFHVMLFNPPYLPTSPDDRIPGPLDSALSGGTRGDEQLLRFLQGLPPLLAPGGRVYVVVSSLTDTKRLDPLVKGEFRLQVLATKDSGMEKLELWCLNRR